MNPTNYTTNSQPSGLEKYQVIKTIGNGSFGVVRQIRRKSDGKILVWKQMNYSRMSSRQKQQLVSEVNILRELNHTNIVKYYDRIIDRKEAVVYIVMEYCAGGDIGKTIKKSKATQEYITESVIWKVFAQVVAALEECHNRKKGKILHRDIKPANIFIDAEANVKLGDFGLSRIMGEESVFAKTHVGTPYYMSPQQIEESGYDEKSDIWSAGCLLYEMAALRPPFEAKNQLSLAEKIKQAKFERIPMRYSEDLQDLIKSMLNKDPSMRPSVNDLVRLPMIAIRMEEKQQKEKYADIKSRLEALRKKENELRLLISQQQQPFEEDKQNNPLARNTKQYSITSLMSGAYTKKSSLLSQR